MPGDLRLDAGQSGADLIAAYRESGANVLAAFRQPGAFEQTVTLPFAPPQPVADDAPAIDRLAACLGRPVRSSTPSA